MFPLIAVSGQSAVSTGPWEYATIAEAEASGDPWVDGDDVQITGGALFLYKSSVAVDSYSGLIHKYPWDGTGTLGDLNSVDRIINSSLPAADPDTWTNMTRTGVGTVDSFTGLSRMRRDAAEGAIAVRSDNLLTSADTETFLIMDRLSASHSGLDSTGSHSYSHIWLQAYYDATQSSEFSLYSSRGVANVWALFNGVTSVNTGWTKTTERRVFMYKKDGRYSLWKDADSVPGFMGTVQGLNVSHEPVFFTNATGAGTTFASTFLKQFVMGAFTSS